MHSVVRCVLRRGLLGFGLLGVAACAGFVLASPQEPLPTQPSRPAGSPPPASAKQLHAIRQASDLGDRIALGKRLFFDGRLASPAGQSCATCHSPAASFSDANHARPVTPGVLPDRMGFRNAPAIAYNCFAPSFGYEAVERSFFGGMFLDGRVSGLVEQAGEPLLNPLEMHNADKTEVVSKVLGLEHAPELLRLFPLGATEVQALAEAKQSGGVETADALDAGLVEAVFTRIGQAISAYELSSEVSPFTSKYDEYLAGRTQLSEQEIRGMMLFNGQACCSECHASTGKRRGARDAAGPERRSRETLFTDFGYENIGIPRNESIGYYDLDRSLNPEGRGFVDWGLGRTMAVLGASNAYYEAGKFKAPTLRNLERTAPYGHNGYFQTLRDVVHFYNTRDVPGKGPRDGETWPPPEVPHTIDRVRMGNLGLSDAQEEDLVAFLKTLTDGHVKE